MKDVLRHPFARITSFMALILTLDQITKQIFLNLIREHGTIELLPFFNLVLVILSAF
jgi:lipoprotein signal peptidase